MENPKTLKAGIMATPYGIRGTTWELRQQHSGQAVPLPVSNGEQAVPTMDNLN